MNTQKETSLYQGKVRVVFMIQRASVDPTTEHVHIVGSVPALGDWDVLQARQTGYSGLNSWIVEEYFDPHTVVDFKLCLLGSSSRDTLGAGDVTPDLAHREDGWFRRLLVTDVPLSVHVTYNSQEAKVVQSMSRMTDDGGPWRLFRGNATELRRKKNKEFKKRHTTHLAKDDKTFDHETTAYGIQIVPDYGILDEILVDTRQLRSRSHEKPSATSVCQTDEGEKKNKERPKKKKKTLNKVLRKYGADKIQKKVEEDDKDGIGMQKMGKKQTSEIELIKDANAERSAENTTNNAESSGWRRAVKMAVPMGLGIAAAAALYFWYRQK